MGVNIGENKCSIRDAAWFAGTQTRGSTFIVAGCVGSGLSRWDWLRCLVRLPPRQFSNGRAGENGRRLAWSAMGTAPARSI